MEDQVKAAFIGLGVMGYPMAGHLRAAGHSVSVYNRTAAKAGAWVADGAGSAHGTPRFVSHRATVIAEKYSRDDPEPGRA